MVDTKQALIWYAAKTLSVFCFVRLCFLIYYFPHMCIADQSRLAVEEEEQGEEEDPRDGVDVDVPGTCAWCVDRDPPRCALDVIKYATAAATVRDSTGGQYTRESAMMMIVTTFPTFLTYVWIRSWPLRLLPLLVLALLLLPLLQLELLLLLLLLPVKLLLPLANPLMSPAIWLLVLLHLRVFQLLLLLNKPLLLLDKWLRCYNSSGTKWLSDHAYAPPPPLHPSSPPTEWN
jgi:hypothetical protein